MMDDDNVVPGRRRKGEIARALIQVLADAPDGLHHTEVIKRVESRLDLTPYENEDYANKPGVRRFPSMVRFGTIGPMKAGWMTKTQGVWAVTDAGRRALDSLSDPGEFGKEIGRLYGLWYTEHKAEKSPDDVQPTGWDEFIGWAAYMVGRPEFDEVEREYKLEIQRDLQEVRTSLLSGSDDWIDLLQGVLRSADQNLVSHYVHRPFLEWAHGHPAEAATAIRELWDSDSSPNGVSQHVWTDDELILTLDLYFREGVLSTSHPKTQEFAELTGLKPNSVSFRLENYLARDPNKSQKGLDGGGKRCSQIFDEYVDDPDRLEREVTRIRATLAEVADGSIDIEQRIRSFLQGVPADVVKGSGSRLNIAAFIAMGMGATKYPPYRVKQFKRLFKACGYEEAVAGGDEADDYMTALNFLDTMIEEGIERGLEVRDRLEAQSIAWSFFDTTGFFERFIPQDERADFHEYKIRADLVPKKSVDELSRDADREQVGDAFRQLVNAAQSVDDVFLRSFRSTVMFTPAQHHGLTLGAVTVVNGKGLEFGVSPTLLYKYFPSVTPDLLREYFENQIRDDGFFDIELTPNDVGETQSNQKGVYVGKELLERHPDFFPYLAPGVQDQVVLTFIDREENEHQWRYVHFSSKNEYRLTKGESSLTPTGWLNQENAKSGDIFRMEKVGGHTYNVELIPRPQGSLVERGEWVKAFATPDDWPEQIKPFLAVFDQLRGTSVPSPRPPTIDELMDELVAETLWSETSLRSILDAAQTRPVVLSGPPGTSKTWVAQRLAKCLAGGDTSRVKMVQFHPSYGYEEFMEGLRPEVDDNEMLTFKVRPGVVRQMVDRINPESSEYHVLVIDEMNRANLPRVLGELMYLFEYRDEPIDLQYTPDFTLPPQLLFIATMNTADRSTQSLDIALRRRFEIFECPPDASILQRFYEQPGNTNEVEDLVDGFEKLNLALRDRLSRHLTIGHSYFMEEVMTGQRLREVWERQLKPLIEEYFLDQPDMADEFHIENFWSSDE